MLDTTTDTMLDTTTVTMLDTTTVTMLDTTTATMFDTTTDTTTNHHHHVGLENAMSCVHDYSKQMLVNLVLLYDPSLHIKETSVLKGNVPVVTVLMKLSIQAVGRGFEPRTD